MRSSGAYTLWDKLNNRLMRALPLPSLDVATQVPIVSFTFDDVPDTALTNGAAILERHGAHGTYYIAGGLAGTVESDRRLIDDAGASELAARGHEIGCHTFAHCKVSTLGRPRLGADLDRNALYLDGLTGSRRRNFAYPYNIASLLERPEFGRRFRTCRAGMERINRGPTDPLFLHAVEIRQPEGHAHSLTRWIDDAVAEPGWLIFFVHDIAPAPTPYGCTPGTFGHLVDYARAAGCAILTVDAALDQLGWPK